MKPLQAADVDLVGDWIRTDAGWQPDDTARRIEWLTTSALKKLGDSPDWGAWETLYLDQSDSRLWVRTYPMGDMHGGGPPRLTCIDRAAARARFGPVVDEAIAASP